jgi:Na+/melibiose symporter-like transporter
LNRHFFPCVPQTHVIPSGSEGSSYSLDTFTLFQLRPFVFVAPARISFYLDNFCSGACFGKRSSFYKYFATLWLKNHLSLINSLLLTSFCFNLIFVRRSMPQNLFGKRLAFLMQISQTRSGRATRKWCEILARR